MERGEGFIAGCCMLFIVNQLWKMKQGMELKELSTTRWKFRKGTATHITMRRPKKIGAFH
jgi:hypothetical protein